MRRFNVSSVLLRADNSTLLFLEETLEYTTHVGKLGYLPLYPELNPDTLTIIVEPFSTDLASIPWWIQWRLRKLGAYNLPAIVHDYLLQHRGLFPHYTRRTIDKIFKEAMIDAGVPMWECSLMYKGVRLNSWWKEEAPWRA